MANALLNASTNPAVAAEPKTGVAADTRVWMYRDVDGGEPEARLFPSVDDVPADEGWRDSPAKPVAAKPAPKAPKAPKAE